MARLAVKLYYAFSVPFSIIFILNSTAIDKSYGMSLFKRISLGLKMLRNALCVPHGTSYKSHLAMALKIFETPPEVSGDIVECGTWKGGSAVNLSLVCKIVGRKLRIYDSFEGLPAGDLHDRQAKCYKKGDYCGTLEEVKSNIDRYGSIECCEFIKGWFHETLPKLNSPVLLAFLDVDLEASLETCVRHIWPNLVDRGYIFIDEFDVLDFCALFFSEKYWAKYFQRTPPGLVGAGVGLPLGNYYVGPRYERENHPLMGAIASAYTRKDMSGYWGYYPDEDPPRA
jgi:hypothetical protein